jgi:hypothetical protein
MPDSAPEKLAAQRSAAPHGLQLEQEDERWGIEAARARRTPHGPKRSRPVAPARPST